MEEQLKKEAGSRSIDEIKIDLGKARQRFMTSKKMLLEIRQWYAIIHFHTKRVRKLFFPRRHTHMKESLAQRIANMNYMKETIAVRIDTYFNMMLSQQVIEKEREKPHDLKIT